LSLLERFHTHLVSLIVSFKHEIMLFV